MHGGEIPLCIHNSKDMEPKQTPLEIKRFSGVKT